MFPLSRARNVNRAGFVFNPIMLFANGEQGAWYDPSSLYTLYRDVNGTTPVVSDGDPVGLMLDKHIAPGPELMDPFDLQSGWLTVSSTIDSSAAFTTAGAGGVYFELLPNTSYLVDISFITTSAAVEIYRFDPFVSSTLVRVGPGKCIIHTTTLQDHIYIRASNAGTTSDITLSIVEIPGNHASQTIAASRPTYRTDGTLHWLAFDGVDDFLSAVHSFPATTSLTTTLAATLKTTGFKNSISFGLTGFRFETDGAGSTAVKVFGSAVIPNGTTLASVGINNKLVYVSILNSSGGWIVKSSEGSLSQGAGTPAAENVGTTIYLGARAAGTAFCAMDLYGTCVSAAAIPDPQLNTLETYLAQKSGVEGLG